MLLFEFDGSLFLLFLIARLDSLAKHIQLVILFLAELLQEILDFIYLGEVPFFVFLLLQFQNSLLDLMGFLVVFLSGKRFLNLSQVYHLARLFWPRTQGFLDPFLEFVGFLFVTSPGLFLYLDGFTFELLHLLIPVGVKLVELFKVCLFDFSLFRLVL